MKNNLFIILTLFSSSLYAISNVEFQNKFNEIKAKQKPHILDCRLQTEKIFNSSYRKLDKPNQNNEYIETTLTKVEALKMLNQYSPEKDFPDDYTEYYNLMANSCEQSLFESRITILKTSEYCEDPINLMNFFKSLIYAARDQKWSDAENKQLKDKIILKINALLKTNKISLVQPLIMVATLDDLISNNSNYSSYIKKVKELRDQAEKINEDLANKNKTLKPQKLSCDKFKQSHENELAASDAVKSKLEAFLKEVKI